jgi:DMSO/TMAO reductase YedYZ molybdopterin-dependent catalytic subunit
LRRNIRATSPIPDDRMEKAKRFTGLFIAAIALLLIVVVVVAFYWQTPRMLYPQEVREYEGQDLSSIGDFRENSIKGPQQINNSTYRLKIMGLVNRTVEYTYDELVESFQNYQKVVTLHCVEGWSVKILWEGFLLEDLLEESGISPEAQVAIFRAYDGYSTSLQIDYLLENDILLGYKMNGLVLPAERGFPLQLVAESRYGYKWIKWITEIELSNDVNYRGYWESRGYPNDPVVPSNETP